MQNTPGACQHDFCQADVRVQYLVKEVVVIYEQIKVLVSELVVIMNMK